jgi:hypothetical protein
VDDGLLWLLDDESGVLRAFPRDDVRGAPLLGHQPYGLAVDPVAVGAVARVYVGAFSDAFVTPVHVPLDAVSPVDAAFVVTTTTAAGVQARRITGGTP